MADGLRAWDANGVLMFDETSPVVKFLGTLTIGANNTGAAQSGTISDGRFTQYAQHVPFWSRIDGGYNNDKYDAAITISGNTLTWNYPNAAAYSTTGELYNRPTQTLIYGIL